MWGAYLFLNNYYKHIKLNIMTFQYNQPFRISHTAMCIWLLAGANLS